MKIVERTVTESGEVVTTLGHGMQAQYIRDFYTRPEPVGSISVMNWAYWYIVTECTPRPDGTYHIVLNSLDVYPELLDIYRGSFPLSVPSETPA